MALVDRAVRSQSAGQKSVWRTFRRSIGPQRKGRCCPLGSIKSCAIFEKDLARAFGEQRLRGGQSARETASSARTTRVFSAMTCASWPFPRRHGTPMLNRTFTPCATNIDASSAPPSDHRRWLRTRASLSPFSLARYACEATLGHESGHTIRGNDMRSNVPASRSASSGLSRAKVGRFPAARPEGAPRRRIHGARDVTFEHDSPSLPLALGVGHRHG